VKSLVVVVVVAAAGVVGAVEKPECARRLFDARFHERLPRAEPPAARYSVCSSMTGDAVRVTVKDGRAEVVAGRARGLVFGAGRLLKAIRWRKDGFDLPDGEYGVVPAKSLRTAYLARHFRNWYMEAPAEEVCRYMDDLALDGINAFIFQFPIPVVDKANETAAYKEAFEATSHRLLAHVNALDCDFCTTGGGNQLPADSPEEFRAVPVTGYGRTQLGFNACPAKPKALAALLKGGEENVARLKGARVGGFMYWPYDEGGCGCTNCSPWGGNGYVGLIERFHGIYAAKCPSAKHIVSTWLFDQDDYERFWKYLEKQDWIDYILCDAHGDFPRYPLEHPIPGRARLVTFPEISMWGRFPWGGLGAIVMPARFERLFRQVEKAADGFIYYSEGIFEDVNKFVVTELYVNPKTGADEILRRYAAYHFAGAEPDDFVRLAKLLEANHLGKDLAKARAAEAREIAERMDAAMLPSLRGAWRWRLVLIRAVCDDVMVSQPDFKPEWIGTHKDVPKPEALRPYIEELVRIYHAERQAKAVAAGKSLGWTCPRMHGGRAW